MLFVIFSWFFLHMLRVIFFFFFKQNVILRQIKCTLLLQQVPFICSRTMQQNLTLDYLLTAWIRRCVSFFRAQCFLRLPSIRACMLIECVEDDCLVFLQFFEFLFGAFSFQFGTVGSSPRRTHWKFPYCSSRRDKIGEWMIESRSFDVVVQVTEWFNYLRRDTKDAGSLSLSLSWRLQNEEGEPHRAMKKNRETEARLMAKICSLVGWEWVGGCSGYSLCTSEDLMIDFSLPQRRPWTAASLIGCLLLDYGAPAERQTDVKKNGSATRNAPFFFFSRKRGREERTAVLAAGQLPPPHRYLCCQRMSLKNWLAWYRCYFPPQFFQDRMW